MIADKEVVCEAAGKCKNPGCQHFIPHGPILSRKTNPKYGKMKNYCDDEPGFCARIYEYTICK